MTLLFIILFSLIGSIGSILLVSTFLLIPIEKRTLTTKSLLAFALGTLLSSALLVLLPEALHQTSSINLFFSVIAGIFVFFIIEKVIILTEKGIHSHNHGVFENKRAGNLILIGDFFHNFLDGIIIATAFMTSIPTGIITSLTVFAHEIPQEAGDFSILIESGYSNKKALIYNIISGIGTLAGAILAYLFLSQVKMLAPYIMAAAAAGFIYIAIAELIPQLNKDNGIKNTLKQLVFIIAGIITIILLESNHSH